MRVRIAVVGSYATGLTMRVDHLPTTGETVLGRGYRVDYGGKGSNQAVGCARLGADVTLVARIGDDAFADMALRLYRDEGVDVTYLKQSSEAPTGVGFIMVEEASGRNCISIDPGANELLTAEDVYQSGRALKSAAVVVAQLEIPVPAAEAALRQGREQGGITILNPAPVRPLPSSVLRMVDILTPNQVEAKILAGQNADAVLRPEDAARELIRRGVRQVVMTLGEEGALLVNETSSQHFPAIRVKAVDTTGAGDAFNAGLATALANGLPLNEAVRFGVVTGGLAVTKDGVIASLPKSNDVLLYYRGLDLEPPSWLGPT